MANREDRSRGTSATRGSRGGEDSSPTLLVPELLARVRQIQIRTHRLVNTALSGGYRSTFRGQGVEFNEVRPYQPGDDVRSIDWNVTARTGQPFIKRYAEERELTLTLVVDTSPSMDFGSRRWTKREAAAQLAALLSYVAIQHGDRVGLSLFGETPGLHLPARKGAKHILRIVREVIAAPVSPGGSDLAAALERELRTLHRRSLVFVLSDFQDEERRDEWSETLMRLAFRHDVIAMRVIDPFEEELPVAGLVGLRALEESRVEEVDTGSKAVRALWSAKARERTEALAETFTRARTEWIDFRIDRDLADPLVAFFRKRMQQHGGRV